MIQLLAKGGEILKERTYLQVSGIIFTLVTLMHVLRLFFGWDVVLGGFVLPMWASVVGIALAGYLSYSAYKLMSK